MSKISLSRRSFLKLSTALAGCAALASTSPMPALAETASGDPGATGETKRIRSFCRACGKMECPTWVTVRDA